MQVNIIDIMFLRKSNNGEVKRVSEKAIRCQIVYVKKGHKLYEYFNCMKDNCRNEWSAEFNSVTKTNKPSGCPKCKESKRVRDIVFFLDSKKIKYIREKKFKKCKDKRILPFDIYIPRYNLIIEVDGDHHYRVIAYGKIRKSKLKAEKRFKDIKRKDKIKTSFCFENNIQLLRIPYETSYKKGSNYITMEETEERIMERIRKIEEAKKILKKVS
jgi:very-short-patch-repair endonuclease